MEPIQQAVRAAVKELFNVDVRPLLTRPAEQFGDYATNIALQLAKQLNKNPRDIAQTLAAKIESPNIAKAEVAGQGFINIWLTDKFLIAQSFEQKIAQPYKDKEMLVEFGDPNPFKEMHIGHLYSYIIGDAICSLLENAGAQVKRLSYHGDVGLHVAKAIWGMQKEGYDPKTVSDPIKNNMGLYYARGASAYEEDEIAKNEIDEINKKVYDQDPSVKDLYEQGKTRSFANFDLTLNGIGIKPEKIDRFLESKAAEKGIETVRQNVGKVFKESDGAVIYEGERVGLHTRVFITSKGLPTYEAKDLGLTELKNSKYPNADQSIIITANEQAEYFKVMLAALAEIDPEVAKRTKHLTHGFVSLSTGKMSSRSGEIYSAISLIVDVKHAAEKMQKNTSHDIQVGAIKYAFTKHRLGGDLVYDVSESISLEGNSGPYLQYAHARARSIIAKAKNNSLPTIQNLEDGERSLARKIGEYPDVVEKAVQELMPHHICTYLYELAQTFNRFYEHNRVIGDERQDIRLVLVNAYAQVLKNGLGLLNITAPDKM